MEKPRRRRDFQELCRRKVLRKQCVHIEPPPVPFMKGDKLRISAIKEKALAVKHFRYKTINRVTQHGGDDRMTCFKSVKDWLVRVVVKKAGHVPYTVTKRGYDFAAACRASKSQTRFVIDVADSAIATRGMRNQAMPD